MSTYDSIANSGFWKPGIYYLTPTPPKVDTSAKADAINTEPRNVKIRKKIAPLVTKAILLGGGGMMAYSFFKTYVKPVVKGKETKKEALKKFWAMVNEYSVAGLTFGIFVGAIVAVQLWFQGTTVLDLVKYFKNQVKQSSSSFIAVPNGGIVA